MTTKLIYMIALVLCSTNAYSEEAVTSLMSKADTIGSGYIIQLMLGLVVVVLCIIVLAWLARKFNRFQTVSDEKFKIVGGISMGARERIVLLQVGVEQILVSITPGKINMLYALDEPIETTELDVERPVEKGFSEKLKTIMANSEREPAKK